MNGDRNFQPLQATLIAEAFTAEGVEYLFLGKGGAILLGYPGITQDVDLFPQKSETNAQRIIAALLKLGFALDEESKADILRCKDFIQIKSGPFDLDLVFAPDGIESFEMARSRRIMQENFPVASLDDIIASKRAAAREKDRIELPLLETFREEYERLNPRPLRSAWEISSEKP